MSFIPLAANSGRGPSAKIWGDCPVRPWMSVDPNKGWGFWDDFTTAPGLAPPTGDQDASGGFLYGQYKIYNTGTVITDVTSSIGGTETGGGYLGVNVDTAGDTAAVGTTSCPFLMNTSSGRFWFEARIATTQIVTNDAQIVIGIAESDAMTFGTAIPLGDANVVSNSGAILGFQRLEDGLGVLRSAYSDRATSMTAVDAAFGTIAALTFTKVGMKYDPTSALRAWTFYQNGVEGATAITAATWAAFTSLDAGAMGPMAAIFADSAVASPASFLYIDWWGAAQAAV